MKAMILAAGRGTRLKALTHSTPKALVTAGGMHLIERLIRKMKMQGVTRIVINVHHFAGQITDFLEKNDHFDIPIDISDESSLLLETGGGILHAAPLLKDGEPFIVHNVDVVSDIDLRKVYQAHLRDKALATLVVRNRMTSRYLIFDEAFRMQGWENTATGEKIIPRHGSTGLRPLAFSGIHVISPEIFSLFTEEGPFSIIDTYLRLCGDHLIRGYRHDEGLWVDAGKPEGLQEVNALL